MLAINSILSIPRNRNRNLKIAKALLKS